VPVLLVAAVAGVVIVGAVIQGVVGFGLGLFAVPLLTMLQGQLLPGPLIIAGASIAVLLITIRDCATALLARADEPPARVGEAMR
jgi:hypothetical protein